VKSKSTRLCVTVNCKVCRSAIACSFGVDCISAINLIMQSKPSELLFFWTFPSSSLLENTTFRKLDLFPSSGEGGGEDTYSVGPLIKSKAQSPSPEDGNRSSFRNVVFSRIPDDGKSPKTQ
jgi:hypothetical protein